MNGFDSEKGPIANGMGFLECGDKSPLSHGETCLADQSADASAHSESLRLRCVVKSVVNNQQEIQDHDANL